MLYREFPCYVGHQFSNWTNKLRLPWKPKKDLKSTSRVAAQREEGAGVPGNSGR